MPCIVTQTNSPCESVRVMCVGPEEIEWPGENSYMVTVFRGFLYIYGIDYAICLTGFSI